MYCTNCGNQVNGKFCPSCGTQAKGLVASKPTTTYQAPPAKKSNAGVVIAIIAGVIFLLMIIGALSEESSSGTYYGAACSEVKEKCYTACVPPINLADSTTQTANKQAQRRQCQNTCDQNYLLCIK